MCVCMRVRARRVWGVWEAMGWGGLVVTADSVVVVVMMMLVWLWLEGLPEVASRSLLQTGDGKMDGMVLSKRKFT